MKKLIVAGTMAVIATLLVPVAAHAEGTPGTCADGWEISSTVGNPIWVKKDRNGNEWICVIQVEKKNGGVQIRLADDQL